MAEWLRFTGADARSSSGPLNETSQPIELLLAVKRDGAGTLGAQIEANLRGAIRDGALRAGARVPSTRDLARQLGVSRRIVVDAYAQLAAEGYLLLRQGARPRVSETSATAGEPTADEPQAVPVRYDFRPSVPDVSTFPRQAWLRSLREALGAMTDADLGYGDPRGAETLRAALADYLGRVRGVVAEPSRVMVTCGYSQGLDLVCRTLALRGGRRIAFEDPSYPEQKELARRAGLEPVAVAVDEQGLVVGELPEVDAVVLTPAHQHPTGVVLSGERRTALLAWLRDHDAIAIDDDYDAEYRYDRAAVGALQGLDPERVVYAGSASKTLAPALRIGWLVLPSSLVEPVREGKRLGDHQTDRIEQHAFADFLVRGELDRHLRRMRGTYRARRDALIAALADELPDATVSGIAAGLHATVTLPDSDDEAAIVEEARRRRIEVGPMAENWADPAGRPPTLLLGYGQIQEAAIRPAVRALAEVRSAVRADHQAL
jgi:GntR family transcriptional regulator / MocR family aminotransferase